MALIRFHPEGRWWIGGTLLVGVLIGIGLLWTKPPWWVALSVGVAWTIWTVLLLNFFRYPHRRCPAEVGMIYAPCDGRVVEVQRTFEPKYFHTEMLQISIFMSPLNVHVNWAPAEGILQMREHMPGAYKVAWHPKASLLNEQTFLAVTDPPTSRQYALRQIAGVLARRISTYPREGSRLRAGEEIGFIKFGSRVDVLLPTTVQVRVQVGQKVRGCLTPIAQW